MEEIFKVGDTVYYRGLKGVVNSLVGTHIYISFLDNLKDRFYINGKKNLSDVTPTLSFTPYTVEQTEEGLLLKGFSQERPWIPERGELVLTAKFKDRWFINRFWEKTKDGKYKIINHYTDEGQEMVGICDWKYYKPYKIN